MNDAILQELQRRRMTITEFALAMGVSRAFATHLISECEPLDDELIDRLCRVFGDEFVWRLPIP